MVYTKNLQDIKHAIYDKLNDDVTLRTLLGGAGRIYMAYPEQVFNFSSYPVVTYQIIDELDRPYNEDDTTGALTNIPFIITILSGTESSKESDDIQARIKVLLNGQSTLTTTNISCLSCYRTSQNQTYDTEFKKFITTAYYSLVSAPKV